MMRSRITRNIAAATTTLLLPFSAVTTALANPTTPQSTIPIESICGTEIPKATDQEQNDAKIEKLIAEPIFQGLSWKVGSTPKDLASDIAEYFTEDEVDELFINGLKNGNGPARTTLEQRLAPFDLECNKARAAWALYQAHGQLVCGPMMAANVIAGVACNVIKFGGGAAVDFNKVCD